MRLIDKVEKLNEEELIYIGSKSAFFFIGYPKDFIALNDKLNDSWKARFKHSVEVADKKTDWVYRGKPKEGTTEQRKAHNFETGKPFIREVTYEELLGEWEERFKAQSKYAEEARQKFDTFKQFEEREIVDCYRTLDNKGTILIVTGEEASNFWFYSEWLRASKKKNFLGRYDIVRKAIVIGYKDNTTWVKCPDCGMKHTAEEFEDNEMTCECSRRIRLE